MNWIDTKDRLPDKDTWVEAEHLSGKQYKGRIVMPKVWQLQTPWGYISVPEHHIKKWREIPKNKKQYGYALTEEP
jgi:hypothetical protein